MSGSIRWRYINSTCLVMFAKQRSIVAEDLRDMLADLAEHSEICRAVVVPNGAAPSPAQREALHGWLEASSSRTAVLSSELLVRGAVTALSWFGLPIRAFPEARLIDALEFIRAPQNDNAAIEACLVELQAEIERHAADE